MCPSGNELLWGLDTYFIFQCCAFPLSRSCGCYFVVLRCAKRIMQSLPGNHIANLLTPLRIPWSIQVDVVQVSMSLQGNGTCSMCLGFSLFNTIMYQIISRKHCWAPLSGLLIQQDLGIAEPGTILRTTVLQMGCKDFIPFLDWKHKSLSSVTVCWNQKLQSQPAIEVILVGEMVHK